MTADKATGKTQLEVVTELGEELSNWGRWGPDDELGTMNFVEQQHVQAAAMLVRRGAVFSLALDFNDRGPQNGGFGRFNPIHVMTRDGNDAMMDTTVRDFYGGIDRGLRGCDDLIIMPLQCGTQWDALSHIVFHKKIYNGYAASEVTSKGARRNGIEKLRDRCVGRGVLLDIPAGLGRDWLDAGDGISGEMLEACAEAQGVSVGTGDILLVRTGALAAVRSEGEWGNYAGGPAPGLSMSSAKWLHDRQVAAVATDTWGAEVIPNETEDVWQPLHLLLLVYQGITLGEMFDLEELAADCRADGVYEFLFCAPPLPISGAVGSPVNPIAIK